MKHGSYSNFTFNPVCVCSCVCVCVGGGGGSIKTVVMIQLIMDKIFKKNKKKRECKINLSRCRGWNQIDAPSVHRRRDFVARSVAGASLLEHMDSTGEQLREARRCLWLGVWVEKCQGGKISSCVFRYTE